MCVFACACVYHSEIFYIFSKFFSFFLEKIVFYDRTIISLLFNSVYRPVLWSVLGGGIISVPRAVAGPSFILAHLQKFIYFLLSGSVHGQSRAPFPGCLRSPNITFAPAGPP